MTMQVLDALEFPLKSLLLFLSARVLLLTSSMINGICVTMGFVSLCDIFTLLICRRSSFWLYVQWGLSRLITWA